MHKFTDNKNREWSIRVDINAIRRVREQHSIDLNALLNDNDLVQKLGADVVLLVDVIYSLVKPQLDAQNVSAEDFGESLYGDPIDAASEALLEAIVDFFPQRRRKPLEAALNASRKGQQLAMAKLDAAIEKGLMDRQMNKDLAKIDEAIAKALS